MWIEARIESLYELKVKKARSTYGTDDTMRVTYQEAQRPWLYCARRILWLQDRVVGH